ncbi:putative general amidase [Aspergillus ibericus CBS 121593]|uniref:General amidase n=1 Tax=Aspergillus ibericus CBS 121593 TaxID=1448316 RepID=A0A395HCV4_9EURO|nr:general amidase [Aspergillus ibericus CBS 121593]RAL05299.1 general amidase [Aspergillus ibericus CBS 121593]
MSDYQSIAARKQQHLDSLIPPEWRLDASQIPAGMLSRADSITQTSSYESINVTAIPRTCGLLTPPELHITEDYNIRALLAEIHSQRLTAEEVTRAFCKRAAIAHQLTRCLTEPLFTQALDRARTLDTHLQSTSRPIGPLHGLPISIKDTFHITNVDATNGLTALAFHPATRDAALVTLLQSLGAIIITKTNVPQTVGTLDTCNHLVGRTLNPLNRRLTVGGSTGGEAALLALCGSMIGFGTDIGGSVRIPPMCTGLYGFKPSQGRLPYGGQQDAGHIPAKGRIGLQPVAGPLARSVEDIGFVMGEIVPRAELFGEDCIPGTWGPTSPLSNPSKPKLRVGVLRSDGIVEPLPPIAKVLDEVARILRRTPGVEVVEVPVPPALSKCQGLANKLMGIDGGGLMMDLLEKTGEPLTPWLKGRIGRRKEITVSELGQLQMQRAQLERAMMRMWTLNAADETRRIDAIIHPVAPHPVPEMDRYNAIGYTSSWVLLDYPAGVVPVRTFREDDLELGREMTIPVGGRWDEANRKLWTETTVDRRVYLDSPLSVQVITPKQHDYDLYRAMQIIDQAIRSESTKGTETAKL